MARNHSETRSRGSTPLHKTAGSALAPTRGTQPPHRALSPRAPAVTGVWFQRRETASGLLVWEGALPLSKPRKRQKLISQQMPLRKLLKTDLSRGESSPVTGAKTRTREHRDMSSVPRRAPPPGTRAQRQQGAGPQLCRARVSTAEPGGLGASCPGGRPGLSVAATGTLFQASERTCGSNQRVAAFLINTCTKSSFCGMDLSHNYGSVRSYERLSLTVSGSERAHVIRTARRAGSRSHRPHPGRLTSPPCPVPADAVAPQLPTHSSASHTASPAVPQDCCPPLLSPRCHCCPSAVHWVASSTIKLKRKWGDRVRSYSFRARSR